MPEIKRFFEYLHALADVARDILAALEVWREVRRLWDGRRHKHQKHQSDQRG